MNILKVQLPEFQKQSLATLLAFLFSISCHAQTRPKNDPGGITPKIVKNHFYTQYPDETFFMQCALKDHKGNMWFGAAGDGIYYFDALKGDSAGFLNFTRNDGLCHNDVLCCFEDKAGTVWFGTRNGLIRYKPTGGLPVKQNFSCILIMANVISNSTHERVPYTYEVAGNFVWSIMQDRTGRLWFGTGKGVYTCSPESAAGNDSPVFTHFLDNDTIKNENKLHLKDVLSIVQDQQGNIWFASGFGLMNGEGICRFDGKNLNSFKPGNLGSFRSILVRKNGTMLFLNAFKGIYACDPQLSGPAAFVNYTEQLGIKNDTITTMLEDSNGTLWLGCTSFVITKGGKGGVWRYDGKSLKKFTVSDGLSDNCVFCIAEDSRKNIWFGTRNTGLCRYNGKTFTDYTDRR